MQRWGIGVDEAFERLRRAAQRLNVKRAEPADPIATRHPEIDRPRDRRE
jgi:ANTAR domain